MEGHGRSEDYPVPLRIDKSLFKNPISTSIPSILSSSTTTILIRKTPYISVRSWITFEGQKEALRIPKPSSVKPAIMSVAAPANFKAEEADNLEDVYNLQISLQYPASR